MQFSKFIMVAFAATAMAYVDCRTPTNAELSNRCTTREQVAGCRGQCVQKCSDTSANTPICINKANNDFDCVCATVAGGDPGF
ncbi:hypothetical protein VTL71DRAFT_14825 [Oculimacula yallundae]|uniref:Uncharacterized protein n=1 Tax=Oculimacula yallundae TaxID=86028 RepID=A0ABR4CJK2_9HELO